MSHKDYTKFSNNKVEPKPIVEQEVVVEEKLEEVAPPTEPMDGVVYNCSMLNVRAEPKINAEVIRTIPANTMVMIDPSESTDEFYKLYLADGIEGFCMKEYIKVE